MNLVSPQLFVTSEHIMSDRASTSSPLSSFFSLVEAGDATDIPGLDTTSGFCGVPWFDSVAADALGELLRDPSPSALGLDCSASRFSRVPRSVLPPSSSERSPDIRKSASIRPSRFSSPSMYLALQGQLEGEKKENTDPLGGFLFFSTWVKTQSVL